MDAIQPCDDANASPPRCSEPLVSRGNVSCSPLKEKTDRTSSPVESSGSGLSVVNRGPGPRPPVPGEETTVSCSDGGRSCDSVLSSPPPPPPPPLDPWKRKQILCGMEVYRNHSTSCASPPDREITVRDGERPPDFAPEGSAAESVRTSRSVSPSIKSDCSASNSTSSSSSSLRGKPPCLAWANSLKNLLVDSEGVELFQTYLDQEQCPTHPLQFWFACRGCRAMQQEQSKTDEEVEKVCRAIYRKFLKSNCIVVSEATRCAITEKLGLEPLRLRGSGGPIAGVSAADSWSSILGQAQQEVENALSLSTYANFLESDLYLQAVTEQIERRRRRKLEREQRKRNKLLKTGSKTGPSVGSLSPSNPVPAPPPVMCGSAVPPSLPSLPEDCKAHLAREALASGKKTSTPSSSSSRSLSLTKDALMATAADRLCYSGKNHPSRQYGSVSTSTIARPVSPHDAGSLTCSSLSAVASSVSIGGGGLAHPYHAIYKSYVPVSRQDSELQSLSSDALTDDTMSTLTDDCASSVGDGIGGPGRGPGCSGPCCVKPGQMLKHGGSSHHLRLGVASGSSISGFGIVSGSGTVGGGGGSHMHAANQSKWQRRMKRQIRLNAEQNKESVRVTETYFIPRTERPIAKEEALAEKNPAEFAKVLISKLEVVVRDLESRPEVGGSEDRWRASALSCLLPPQLLEEAMQEKIKACIVDNLDSDQAILDNHVNRVWADSGQQTPRTPPVTVPLHVPIPVSVAGSAAKRVGASSSSGMPPLTCGLRQPGGGGRVPSTMPPIVGQPYVYAGNGKPPAYQATGGGIHHSLRAVQQQHQQHHPHHHHHHRKREKDASSTLSSDSGNVFDSRGSLDLVGQVVASPGHGAQVPKSKSVPEWLAEGHHHHERERGRQHAPVPAPRGPAEGGGGTDSGLSVTSADSSAAAAAAAAAASIQAISPKERVLTWMLRNEKYDGNGTGGGGSERGSSQRHSRASSSVTAAAGTFAEQQQLGAGSVSGLGPVSSQAAVSCSLTPLVGSSSSRFSHRRHVSSGGGGGSGRSISVERNSRLSWKQQYQQQLQEYQTGVGPATCGLPSHVASSLDDSGIHLIRSLRDTAVVASASTSHATSKLLAASVKPRLYSGGGKSELVVSGVGVDDDGGGGGLSTVIVWVYCDEPVPYMSRLPGSQVTLKQFKQLLPRKGHHRYFFKKEDTEFGSGVVQEEILDDVSPLPMWEGKVFATVKPM